MAKFRNGNLVLTSTQEIIQGARTVLDDNSLGFFDSLKLDLGATINEFSIDGTMVGNSDTALPTEKAVVTYVAAQLAAYATNKIYQLDSKVEVTDTGSNGKIVFVTDNTQVFEVGVKAANAFYAGVTDPTNTTRLNYDGYFYATRVYNAVWNDIADFQDLDDNLIPGKCYYDSVSGAKICDIRCQQSVIGIASDTYGYGVGQSSIKSQVPIAVCGWVLAFVNGKCEMGDALTSDYDGNLVKMTEEEKRRYPERIVAIYKKKEYEEEFGTSENKIKVNGRHWVKVK